MLSTPSQEFPWTSPPWLGGATKYRMGLRPIKPNRWFQGRPSLRLRVHKYGMLRRNYPQVVQTHPTPTSPSCSQIGWRSMVGFSQSCSQRTYSPISLPSCPCKLQTIYALETSGEQRFIAGSVCSPSYWNIRRKSVSMAAVHQPVTTLETKIGEQIRRFIRHSPMMTPFERSNWFVHGDRERLHFPRGCNHTQPL